MEKAAALLTMVVLTGCVLQTPASSPAAAAGTASGATGTPAKVAEAPVPPGITFDIGDYIGVTSTASTIDPLLAQAPLALPHSAVSVSTRP